MGETKNRTGLIDFLYKDMSRIESLFAQLYQGSLREIATTQTMDATKRSSFKLGIHAIEGNREAEKHESESVEKRIDPHDQKILDLLSTLNLPLHDSLPSSVLNGQIILIRGQIFVRNYQTIKTAMPLILSSIIPTGKQNKKELNTQKRVLDSFLKLVPMGIEIEITIDNQESLVGVLKEQYLTESPDDLLKFYGNQIPGDWYCLGILDPINNSKTPANSSDMRASIDEFALAIRSMYNQNNSNYVITPILIYRELNY